jgi:hypothetical protein
MSGVDNLLFGFGTAGPGNNDRLLVLFPAGEGERL